MANQSEQVLNQLLQFEEKRLKMLKNVEEARLELHHNYAEKRAKLLSENKETFSWLLDSLSELRKERINFQKKAISEINDALLDSKVPEDLTKEWLHLITKLYHSDVSVAQKMVSVDFEEIDDQAFDSLKEVIENKLYSDINDHVQAIKEEISTEEDGHQVPGVD
jgi:hypothetical protein